MTTTRVRDGAASYATLCGEDEPLGRYLSSSTRTRHTPAPISNGVMITGGGDGISARPSIAALGRHPSTWPRFLCWEKAAYPMTSNNPRRIPLPGRGVDRRR